MAEVYPNDMMDDEVVEEARDVVATVVKFIEDDPRFRLAAVIVAAIDDDTGEIYANEMILISEESRAAILDALKEDGRRDFEPVIN